MEISELLNHVYQLSFTVRCWIFISCQQSFFALSQLQLTANSLIIELWQKKIKVKI